MREPDDITPPSNSPPLNQGPSGRPAHRRGAARADGVPKIEHVQVTAPDLERRKILEKTRSRLVIAAGGFSILFLGVVVKLALATIVLPKAPHRVDRPVADLVAAAAPKLSVESSMPGQR